MVGWDCKTMPDRNMSRFISNAVSSYRQTVLKIPEQVRDKPAPEKGRFTIPIGISVAGIS
jgi:hypothetical protein